MLRKQKYIGVTVMFALLIGAIPTAFGQKEKQVGSVTFVSPISVQEALEFAKSKKIQPTLLEHEFILDGEIAGGGVPTIDGESVIDTEKRLQEGFRNFLSIQSSSIVDETLPEDVKEVKRKQVESFKALQKNIPTIKIRKIEGKADSFSDVKKDGKVKQLDIKPVESFTSKLQSFLMPKIEKAFALAAPESWASEWLTINVGQFTSGNRFGQLDMKWDNVLGFGVYSTYEPDFFTYNYDNNKTGTYFDKRTTGSDLPNVRYYSSNLPRFYLDTRFGDKKEGNSRGEFNELAYTIGSAQAYQIGTNTNYYTYFETAPGTKTTDKIKLQGQLGYRHPTYCYTTWCSFGFYGDGVIWFEPSWSTSVPVSKTLRY